MGSGFIKNIYGVEIYRSQLGSYYNIPIKIGNVNVEYTIDQYPTYNWLRVKAYTRGNERWEPLEYERHPQEHFLICGYKYYVNGSSVKEVRFKFVDTYNGTDIYNA